MAQVTNQMIYELAIAIRDDLDDLVEKVRDLRQEVIALRIDMENFPRPRAMEPAH